MQEGNKKAEQLKQALFMVGITLVVVFGLLMQTYTTAKKIVDGHHPAAEIIMKVAGQVGVNTQLLAQAVSSIREVENTVQSVIHYGITRITQGDIPFASNSDSYFVWQLASSQQS